MRKLFTYLGDISYSLYLSHAVTITMYSFILKRVPLSPSMVWATIPVVIVLSVMSAGIVHHFVEKPIHNRLRFQRNAVDSNDARVSRHAIPELENKESPLALRLVE